MTNRVLAVVALSFVVFAFGCTKNNTDQFVIDLQQMTPDDTAQKREAVMLVNRAYEVYHDNDRSEEKRVREAARMLEEAVRLDPGFATAHMNLGVLHLEQDNLPTAVVMLRDAQRLLPSDSRPSYFLGVAYYKMGHAKAAVDSYLMAIQIDQADVRAVRGLTLACRSIHYANDTTLEVLKRSQLREPDEEWRHIIDREIIRQERQLDMG
ncbi:MAG: tetratricopeptide repeat protein [Phycisphaera sp.]|nr:MAG: tetratricopeptide repeat protein [Phycisphaera sp.]